MSEYIYKDKCPFLMGERCQEIGCAIYNGTECGFVAQSNAMEQLSTDISSIQESLSAIATALKRIADKEG